MRWDATATLELRDHKTAALARATGTLPSGASVTSTSYETNKVTETEHTATATYQWEIAR